MQEIGLLKEARGKRCHTVLLKLQRKGFSVLKRYKDAKNNIFPSNSVKRRLFMKGKWPKMPLGLLKEARGKRCHTVLIKLQRKGFLVLKRYKDAKITYFLRTRLKDGHLWKESDLRCPLDQGDSFSLLFLISTWTWFRFYRLPFTEKKSYAKKQLLFTLLYLTRVWICVYFLVVLQLCFDFEARVWLVIR